MKKLCAFLLLLACSVSFAQAQDGNDGIMLINEEPATTLSEKDLNKCVSLMKDAQWYVKRKEFGKAKAKLEELLAINPNDAQAKVLLEQCKEGATQYGESAEKKPSKVAFGAEAGADFFEKIYGIHLGVTMRYGRYTDMFNLTAGVDFILHQSYKAYDYLEYTRSISLGGQIAVPVMAQFNVLKCTETTRFYVGVGPEFAIKLYGKDVNEGGGSTKKTSLMSSSSVAGMVKVGVTGNHFDAGIYYKHYVTDLIPDEHKAYQENGRIGFNVAYYF